jgi:hypothetical protein
MLEQDIQSLHKRTQEISERLQAMKSQSYDSIYVAICFLVMMIANSWLKSNVDYLARRWGVTDDAISDLSTFVAAVMLAASMFFLARSCRGMKEQLSLLPSDLELKRKFEAEDAQAKAWLQHNKS